MPILSLGSIKRDALAARLPIKFRVNMPVGCVGLIWNMSEFGDGATGLMNSPCLW